MSTFLYQSCKICCASISIENNSHQLVKCSNCELIFSQKKFSKDEFIDTYDRLYNKTDQYSNHIKEFNSLKSGPPPRLGYNKTMVINKILKTNPKHILEIGAGIGLMGFYLTKKGYEYRGIEIDNDTAKKAQSLGLKVEKGSFEIAGKWTEKFDAVIAFEVIEHIQELDSCLRIINQSLKKGGYFGFTVPNYNKTKNYTPDAKRIRQSPPPIHLNFFTMDNISKIFPLYSFEILFLKKRNFPYLNLKKIDTYKHIIKSIIGVYEGPNILCIAKKI